MRIEIELGKQCRPVVDSFYERNSSKGRARDDDVFFLAFESNILIGCVRYCIEQGTPLLRTMMIDKDHRGKRVGQRLLLAFAGYLEREKISNVYCLPYAHLEKFYGSIGFEKIPDEDAPDFLHWRMKSYAQTEANICMRRP